MGVRVGCIRNTNMIGAALFNSDMLFIQASAPHIADYCTAGICLIPAGQRHSAIHAPSNFFCNESRLRRSVLSCWIRHVTRRERLTKRRSFMSSRKSIRIGIIGSGAIGGFYGFMLAKAGYSVHFLLRSEYSFVQKNGIDLQSDQIGYMPPLMVNAYKRVEDMPPCDWLLLGAKATSNAQLAPLLQNVAAPGAKVLVMQNGLGVEDGLRDLIPASLHLVGGLCWIAVQRLKPGVIKHIGLGDLHVGYHSGPAENAADRSAILSECTSLMNAASVRCLASSDLVQARWRKLVWNIPYNGLSVMLDAGSKQMTDQDDSRALLIAMMQEVVCAAGACGHSLPPALPEEMIALTQTIPEYLPSMYLDFALKRPMELDVMYSMPLSVARAAGCAMPKVESLYRALRFKEAQNLLAHA
jgi:2-dehydropantoate 2-reductase